MITIDQLLETMDLDFEPRFVTKDKDKTITIWESKPISRNESWTCFGTSAFCICEYLKLSEFDGKDWTECIYEVPRKTTGKIYRFDSTSAVDAIYDSDPEKFKKFLCVEIVCKLNKVIDAVNELKGANQ